MPTTILTIPRELRDEIYTTLALSDSFQILLTCRRLNEEGTPFLDRHGVYRLRALNLNEHRTPARPQLVPSSKIQNLYLSMPPTRLITDERRDCEISHRTRERLEGFADPAIRRDGCYVSLQKGGFSESLGEGLQDVRGFDVVRVELVFGRD